MVHPKRELEVVWFGKVIGGSGMALTFSGVRDWLNRTTPQTDPQVPVSRVQSCRFGVHNRSVPEVNQLELKVIASRSM